MRILVKGPANTALNAAWVRGIEAIVERRSNTLTRSGDTMLVCDDSAHTIVANWLNEPGIPPYSEGSCLWFQSGV